MASWYEVFDNEEVLYETRRHVGILSGFASATVVVSLILALLAYADGIAGALLLAALLVLWVALALWTARRVRQLRRVVWCIKLSDRQLVGYDYARNKLTIDWTKVERIEMRDDGLQVVGPACTLEVPHLYPDFAALSHRIAHYADFYETPVFVDGHPWQQLDVYQVYPFLADSVLPEDPHGPASS